MAAPNEIINDNIPTQSEEKRENGNKNEALDAKQDFTEVKYIENNVQFIQ